MKTKNFSVLDWVSFDDTYREVKSINSQGCVELYHTDIDPDDLITDIKYIQPVVITRKLLHQLGFKQSTSREEIFTKGEIVMIDDDKHQMKDNFRWQVVLSSNGGSCKTDITYIHELQHLCTMYGCDLCLNLWESYLRD